MQYNDGMSNDPYWERTRYNPNLRRDALYVAQQTGSGAGKFFWGALLFLGVAFWPSWALHGETRTVVSWAWYGTIAAVVIWVLAAVSVRQGRGSRHGRR